MPRSHLRPVRIASQPVLHCSATQSALLSGIQVLKNMSVDYTVGGEAVVLRTYYPKDGRPAFPTLLLAAEDVPAAVEEALKVLGAVGSSQLYIYVSCAAAVHGSGLVCWLMRPACMAFSHRCARP